VALAIVGPEWAPFDTAAAQLALGRELGLTVSMHMGIGTSGPRAGGVTALHRAGLLGPDLNLAHCNTIGDDEVRMLVDAGAGVTVTPVSECMLACGPVPYSRFRAAGGAPGLGVDVVTLAGPGMFEQLRAVLWLERQAYAGAEIAAGRDPVTVLPAAGDLLPAATIDSARAIGMADEIGSLAVGKRADIAVLDGLAHLTGEPGAGVAGAVVSSLGPENVRTVLVEGRVVKRDGRLVGTDLAALRADAVEVARRVRHDSGALSSAG
jgi:5-methylthioadenosine/S-adenosylhomocysteine deaminase